MKAKSMLIKSLLRLLFFLLISVCSVATAKTIYVDYDAIGANDGTSWENALNYLQDAIANATAGDDILVAHGIYKPDQGIGITLGDRRASFHLKSSVTIKGGYAGFSTPDPNIRDVDRYETILSGDLNGNDVYVKDPDYLLNERTRADNSWTVVLGNNTDETAILDGFTITSGYIRIITFGLGGEPAGGAGMIISSGSPTIINCTFTDNITGNTGGGLLIYDESNPTLLNCNFIRNCAESGGGGIFSSESSPTLINCKFNNNYARCKGGAMFNFRSNPELTDCTFSGNSIPDIPNGLNEGGGAMRNSNSNLVLNNCQFSDNTGSLGAGMYNENNSSLILENCTFRANIAELSGGGMFTIDSNDLRLIDCIFSGNSAKHSGGGMTNKYSNVVLVNCIFSGNKAYDELRTDPPEILPGEGGGLYTFGNIKLINCTNCTFTGNWAQQGRAIAKSGTSDFMLTNCILWNGGNEIFDIIPNRITFDISYSNIQNVLVGKHNINEDPLFANPGYWADADDPNIVAEPNDPNAVWIDGDYHLKSQAGRWDPASQSWVVDVVTSPCIDAGDPNSPIGHEPFPNGGIINMGAYGSTAEASKSPSGLYAKYGGGTGEPNNPYLIYTAEQMNTIGLYEEDWDKHFKLMADIDLSAYTGTDFNIIGYVNIVRIGRDSQIEGKPFAGVFDGNGHTISNFSYSTTDPGEVGLFGFFSGENAHIKNLGLINPDINGQDNVGSLVGEIGSSTVSGCYVEGGSVSGDGDVGGLVGKNGGIITNCTTSGSVSGDYMTGGLVGYNTGTITDCYSSTIVLGKHDIGGLVGYDLGGTITRCASSGSISGTRGYVGGLLGCNNYGTVTTCYSSANVSGILHVGGLVGDNEGTISNCYSLGSVTGAYTYDTGGLVGFNWGSLGSTITDCYSAGSVLGKRDTGGLVGSNNGDKDTVRNCFWDIQTSEQSTSAGGTGKTTSEMQIESTFTDAGWDFAGESKNGTEDIWTFYEGVNYPRLAWEKEPIEPVAPSPYGGGAGTAANPYLIYTAEQLNMIGLLQHDWGRHFKLMADIDLSGFTGTDFNIIGYAQIFEDRNPFTGVFDGNGKTISNFSHTSTDRNYIALFAYIAGSNALIKNLGMVDPNINAGSVWSWRVASLVAINSGTISNCYVKGGTISGNEDVGGLVGDNFINGKITNCYSSTSVSGNKDAGGLVGENSSGTITYCYSTASVSGGHNLGGLVGHDTGDIISSFWDIEASGQTTSSGGIGKTTAEMQTAGTFIEAGWDFVDESVNGTEDIWWIIEGQDYPRLLEETY